MRNRARDEVEAMPWPEYISDEEGDLRRENERLRRERNVWRAWGLVGWLMPILVYLVRLLFG